MISCLMFILVTTLESISVLKPCDDHQSLTMSGGVRESFCVVSSHLDAAQEPHRGDAGCCSIFSVMTVPATQTDSSHFQTSSQQVV